MKLKDRIIRIVDRQLRRHNLSRDQLPTDVEEWQAFLESVQEGIKGYEDDRYLLERSIEISSREMKEQLDSVKSMTTQLNHASRLASLGTMASGVAHELNNPITGIQGYAQIIRNDSSVPKDKIKMLDRILGLCARMTSTVSLLRRLSRQSDQKKSRFNIEDVINDTFELLGRQLDYDNIHYSIEIDENILPVEGDYNRIISIFQNLVTNSRDAFLERQIEDKRKINLVVMQGEGQIEITYTDNAGGIPKDAVDQIFDPFFTTKEVGKGTGLGLSIACQVLKEHDGKISLENEIGKGCTFKISIPPAGESKEQITSISEALGRNQKESKAKSRSHKKVLVIDDEDFLCDFLEQILGEHFNVLALTDSSEAYERLGQEKFDLVVTDMKMPKIDGKKIIERVESTNPDTKIVMMSGHFNISESKARKLRKHLFIEKPLPNPDDLVAMISDYLESKSSPAA